MGQGNQNFTSDMGGGGHGNTSNFDNRATDMARKKVLPCSRDGTTEGSGGKFRRQGEMGMATLTW